jgi:hypothetical protein
MRRTAPRLVALQDPQALSFEQVREALDPGTVMLSYSVGKEQTHLFIIARGRELQVKTLEVGRQALEADPASSPRPRRTRRMDRAQRRSPLLLGRTTTRR